MQNIIKKSPVFLFALFFALISTLSFAKGASENFVLVKKAERILIVVKNSIVIGRYNIQLGTTPVGHKQFKGDRKTPEGKYKIDFKNRNSKYHLSIHIDYPNSKDKEYARKRGRSPGGDIYIHGMPNQYKSEDPYFFKGRDWTNGCIALTNKEIEEVAKLVPNGTTIYIIP